jgi:hypothetical protein
MNHTKVFKVMSVDTPRIIQNKFSKLVRKIHPKKSIRDVYGYSNRFFKMNQKEVSKYSDGLPKRIKKACKKYSEYLFQKIK